MKQTLLILALITALWLIVGYLIYSNSVFKLTPAATEENGEWYIMPWYMG